MMDGKLFDNNPEIKTSNQLLKSLKNAKENINGIEEIAMSDLSIGQGKRQLLEKCLKIIDLAESISLSFRNIIQMVGEAEIENDALIGYDQNNPEYQKNEKRLIKEMSLRNINASCKFEKGVLEIVLPFLPVSNRSDSSRKYSYNLANKVKAVIKDYEEKSNIKLSERYMKPLKLWVKRFVVKGARNIPDLTNIDAQTIVDAICYELNKSDNYVSIVEVKYETEFVNDIKETKTVMQIGEK